MANVRISELLLLSPPDLTDEIIVNDVDVLVTKRSTLQDLRDLANENIDDIAGGSGITGNLVVSGLINGIDPDDIITQADLDALGLGSGLLCVRDSADGSICGVALLGDTRVDSDLTVLGDIFGNGLLSITGDITSTSGVFTGNGSGLTDIQFALTADSADHARYSIQSAKASRADSAAFAYTADSADHARFAIESEWSRRQQVINVNTDAIFYPTFSPVSSGIDSVNTDLQLTYNPNDNIFTSGFFQGDGSLLTNIIATSTSANEVNAKSSAVDANHHVMFRFSAAGLDSTNTDGSLLYNPNTNILRGTDSSDLFVYGRARNTEQTDANASLGTGTYSLMIRGTPLGRDSVSTNVGLTFNAATATLQSTNFSGDGSLITAVDAATAINATNVAVTAVTDASVYYVHIGSASSGNDGVNVDTNLQVNPGTNVITYAEANASISLGQSDDFVVSTQGTTYSFDVVNNASTAYTFSSTGVWFPTSEDNPILYLRRGDTYRFDMAATGHPFEIRVSNGGAAYSTGVTNNTQDAQPVTFAVPMSAPSTLYYQCTVHSGMGAVINIV
tara:strand:+ start:20774 stop:22459 length:1686 start_codon:yes stop_codon:yes gene_type:complete